MVRQHGGGLGLYTTYDEGLGSYAWWVGTICEAWSPALEPSPYHLIWALFIIVYRQRHSHYAINEVVQSLNFSEH